MKKALALVLAIAMVMSMVCFASAEDFTDAAEIDQKNTEAVTVLSSLGIIAGMGDGTFAPQGTLTRAQAAKIICYMLLGKDGAEALPTADGKFGDVPASHWSNKYVNYCAEQGIAAGTGAGKFNPNGKLTGFAFGKMLLCGVAGFNAESEGLTGDKWEINTDTLLKQETLNMGVTLSSTGMAREDACHLALNFLFYKEGEDPEGTLAYKTFKVVRAGGKNDKTNFQRPTVIYTSDTDDAYWEGSDLNIAASPFFFSPSGVVTGGKLYTACGNREVPTENMKVFRDCLAANMPGVINTILKGSADAFEKDRVIDGVSLEGYYDATADLFTFIILSTRAAKVASVTPASKTSDGTVLEPGTVTFENGVSLESNDFTEEDIGKYVCVQGGCEKSWNDPYDTILNVFPGEIVSGKLSRADKSTVAVAGKSFKINRFSELTGAEYLEAGGQIGDEVNILVNNGICLTIWQ